MLFIQNTDAIPAREVGYILRSLGQNPTEDEILALVCEAGCDWEVNNRNAYVHIDCVVFLEFLITLLLCEH